MFLPIIPSLPYSDPPIAIPDGAAPDYDLIDVNVWNTQLSRYVTAKMKRKEADAVARYPMVEVAKPHGTLCYLCGERPAAIQMADNVPKCDECHNRFRRKE